MALDVARGSIVLITDHTYNHETSQDISAVKILLQHNPLLKHIFLQTMMELLPGFQSELF